MIYKGLDDEEAGFLTMVAQQQADRQALVRQQEKEEIVAFRVSGRLVEGRGPVNEM